jgi:hypothetical protein
MIVGGVFVVVGAIGVLVSGRSRAGAPEPDRKDLPPESQKEEPNS